MNKDNVNISIPKDGGIPSVEGSKALAASVEHAADDKALKVRVTFHAAGDDALHAGSMVGEFTLTAPEFVPNSPLSADEQSTIGHDYAVLMVAAMGQMATENLGQFFEEAVEQAVKQADEPSMLDKVTNAAMLIALILIAKHKGDKDAAKAEASETIADPEYRHMLEGGLDPDAVVEILHSAIDLASVAVDG